MGGNVSMKVVADLQAHAHSDQSVRIQHTRLDPERLGMDDSIQRSEVGSNEQIGVGASIT